VLDEQARPPCLNEIVPPSRADVHLDQMVEDKPTNLARDIFSPVVVVERSTRIVLISARMKMRWITLAVEGTLGGVLLGRKGGELLFFFFFFFFLRLFSPSVAAEDFSMTCAMSLFRSPCPA